MFFSQHWHPQHHGVLWIVSEPFPVLAARALLLRGKYSEKAIIPQRDYFPKSSLSFVLSSLWKEVQDEIICLLFQRICPGKFLSIGFLKILLIYHVLSPASGAYVSHEGTQHSRPRRKGLGRKCVNQAETSCVRKQESYQRPVNGIKRQKTHFEGALIYQRWNNLSIKKNNNNKG